MLAIGALGIAALAGAFSTDSEPRATGGFRAAAETTSIQVKTYAMGTFSPLVEDATTAWCRADPFPFDTDILCLLSVKNLKTSGPVTYSFRTTDVVNADGKRLAESMTVKAYSVAVPINCVAGLLAGTPVFHMGLSANPSFGDPAPGAQAGDRTLASAQLEFLCLQIKQTISQFDALTGATFVLDANDGP